MNEPPELCRWVYFRTLAVGRTAFERNSVLPSYNDTVKILPWWMATRLAWQSFTRNCCRKIASTMIWRFLLSFAVRKQEKSRVIHVSREGLATKNIPTSNADANSSLAGGSTLRTSAGPQSHSCPQALAMQAATKLNRATTLYSATVIQKQGGVCHETNRL